MRKLLLFALLLLGASTHAENYPYRADCLWMTVPDHADWLYKTGEKAKVEVGLYRYGIPQDVEVTYEIGPDMMPATSTGKVTLKGGRAVIDMGIDRVDSVLADSCTHMGCHVAAAVVGRHVDSFRVTILQVGVKAAAVGVLGVGI